MADETDKFLSVTEAAEKMHEALSELKQQTEDYSEAGVRLESAAAEAQALTDATIKVLGEQQTKWEELKRLLDDQVRPALDRLDDSAEKQAAYLSTLSAAVAGQQGQLTLLQQGVTDNSLALSRTSEDLSKLSGNLSGAVLDAVRRATNATYAGISAALFSLAALVLLIVHIVTG